MKRFVKAMGYAAGRTMWAGVCVLGIVTGAKNIYDFSKEIWDAN